MALLSTPSHYLASTEVSTDSWLLVWDHASIRRLARQYPQLLDNVSDIAARDYFAWYLADHEALISHTARQRPAGVLGTLAQCIGRGVLGGIELDVTNEELANAANVTAPTASRLLSEWQRTEFWPRGAAGSLWAKKTRVWS